MKLRFVCALALSFAIISYAETPTVPLIGAEVWLEQGQTPAQIDGWFHQLAAEHMPVARIFMMWSDLEPRSGQWDYSLYDTAFRAAEKYHVRIVATLTPGGPPPFLHGGGNQGNGYPPTAEAKAATADYIAHIVERYKSSPALDTWLLVNEPGMAPADYPLAAAEFRIWLAQRYASIADLNRSWGTAYGSFADVTPGGSSDDFASKSSGLDWFEFWRTYQSEQLAWLAEQVRLHDSNPAHGIHVNPHALMRNLAGLSDDLASWRPFLTSLGCSIHPGWHFGVLERDQFALGVSYINDLVAGAVEPKPHWVTELQGGNNIYSATKPMDPTPEDIAQWVWTSVGAGADRVIFWLLNARRQGTEAGEWSLLNFEQRPSKRLDAAAKIAQTIDSHSAFFTGAHAERSPVAVILSLETMNLQEEFHDSDFPGRDTNAHLLAVLGMYQALSQLGVPPQLKFIGDYDWRAKTSSPRVAILPDARALTAAQIADLDAFVNNGNTLLITGLTGFYDPHALAWPLAGFPLAPVTGGSLQEVHFLTPAFDLTLSDPSLALPSHLWASSIAPHTAKPIAERDGEITATERTTPNGGRVLWIPSPVDIGGWLRGTEPLANFLETELGAALNPEPFRFARPQPGCLLRVLTNGSQHLTVVTNGGDTAIHCAVEHTHGAQSEQLWGEAPVEDGDSAVFALPARGTAVTLWR